MLEKGPLTHVSIPMEIISIMRYISPDFSLSGSLVTVALCGQLIVFEDNVAVFLSIFPTPPYNKAMWWVWRYLTAQSQLPLLKTHLIPLYSIYPSLLSDYKRHLHFHHNHIIYAKLPFFY